MNGVRVVLIEQMESAVGCPTEAGGVADPADRRSEVVTLLKVWQFGFRADVQCTYTLVKNLKRN